MVDFEKYKKVYLKDFRGYYHNGDAKRKRGLKKTLYGSMKLNREQKDEFWNEVIKKDEN